MSFVFLLAYFFILVASIYEMFGTNKPLKGLPFWGLAAYLIFLAGFRYYTGPDDFAYARTFRFIKESTIGETLAYSKLIGMEEGYLLLNYFVGQVAGFAMLLFIVALTSILCKFSAINRFSPFLFISLLFYFVPYYFFDDIIQIRQGLATGICLFAIKFIFDRKLLFFIITVLIAYVFHNSAIVFILAYFLVRINVNQVGIVLSVVGGLIATQIGLLQLLEPVLSVLPIGVGEKYEAYLTEENSSQTTILGDIVRIILVIFILIFDTRAKASNPYYAPLRNLYLFGIFMYFGFGKGIFSIRLPGYYICTIYFLIPIIINSFNKNDLRRGLIYLLFVIYSALLLNRFATKNARGGFGNYRNVIIDNVNY